MKRTDLSQAKSELTFLNRISSSPGISKLSKLSIATRIEALKEDIERSSRNGIFVPAKAAITYKGLPVWGSHGVAAEFGSLATAKFADAIAAIAASLSGGILGERGPIPNRAQNQILITGTVLGSFGFEFEEAPPASAQLTLEGTSAVSQAFELMADLLESSTKSDEELSEPLSKIGTRSIAVVSEFLEKLATNGAYCTFRTGNHEFSFTSAEQIRISKSRLSPENIHESSQTISGQFLGAFPADRRF